MSTTSLSEIVNKAGEMKTPKDKASWLKQNESLELRTILDIIYNPKKYEWTLPKSIPPYNKSTIRESHGMLYREIRKLPYFIKLKKPDGSVMFSGNGLTQIRREALFIQMMESIDAGDAELMELVLLQKPVKGLTKNNVKEAFPDMFAGEA